MAIMSCLVDGCETAPSKRGWCNMHYIRWRRHGDPGVAERIRGVNRPLVCEVDGCERPHRGFGLCGMHLARKTRHGGLELKAFEDRAYPRGEAHPNWVGDSIGYPSAHSRLRWMRGSASAHPCVDCSAPADDWSYNHDDPNEKLDHDRGACPQPYSPDPDHYSPRCRPCHRKFDSSQKEAHHV